MTHFNVTLSAEEIFSAGLEHLFSFEDLNHLAGELRKTPQDFPEKVVQAFEAFYAKRQEQIMEEGDPILIAYPVNGNLRQILIHNASRGVIDFMPRQEMDIQIVHEVALELISWPRGTSYDFLYRSWIGELADLPWRVREVASPKINRYTFTADFIEPGSSTHQPRHMYFLDLTMLGHHGLSVDVQNCTLTLNPSNSVRKGILFDCEEAYDRAIAELENQLKMLFMKKAACRPGQEVFNSPTARVQSIEFPGRLIFTSEDAETGEEMEISIENPVYCFDLEFEVSKENYLLARPAKVGAFYRIWAQALGLDTSIPEQALEAFMEEVDSHLSTLISQLLEQFLPVLQNFEDINKPELCVELITGGTFGNSAMVRVGMKCDYLGSQYNVEEVFSLFFHKSNVNDPKVTALFREAVEVWMEDANDQPWLRH